MNTIYGMIVRYLQTVYSIMNLKFNLLTLRPHKRYQTASLFKEAVLVFFDIEKILIKRNIFTECKNIKQIILNKSNTFVT